MTKSKSASPISIQARQKRFHGKKSGSETSRSYHVPTKVVTLHDEAAADYDAAFEWCLKRSANAAVRFDEAVERALTEIARAPQRWPRGSYGTRRFLLRGFPYVLGVMLPECIFLPLNIGGPT